MEGDNCEEIYIINVIYGVGETALIMGAGGQSRARPPDQARALLGILEAQTALTSRGK